MKKLLILLIVLFSISGARMVSGQGSDFVDPSFAPVIENFPSSVYTIVKQPDGKILTGGNFTLANNRPASNIARFNADGSVDTTFSTFSVSVHGNGLRAVAPLPNGKIFIGGNFFRPSNGSLTSLLRLNANGTFDSTFTPTVNGTVYEIKVQPDGKILVGGSFTSFGGQSRVRLMRLNADGSLDTTFNYSALQVDSIALQPDGKIIVSEAASNGNGTNNFKISRLNADGTIDNSFTATTTTGANYRGYSLKIQPDGKILLGGVFFLFQGSARACLLRLNSDGSLDASFNPSITLLGLTQVRSVDIDGAGRIVIGGDFSAVNGAPRNKIARLNPDGTTDASFSHQSGADDLVYAVRAEPDNRIIFGGDFRRYDGAIAYRFARLDENGSYDQTFASRINTNGTVKDVEIQTDNKILLGGNFFYNNGTGSGGLARINPDGSVDNSFANFFQTRFYFFGLEDFELLPDGKIVGIGQAYLESMAGTDFGIVRVNSNGFLDNTFSPVPIGDNISTVVEAQANGQILVGGVFSNIGGAARNGFARFNTNGTIDSSFNPTLSSQSFPSVSRILVRNDGKILISGAFNAVNGATRNGFAQLNADGTTDAGFTASVTGTVSKMRQLRNGNILIAGSFTAVSGLPRKNIARLLPSGELDNTFNPPANFSSSFNAVAEYTDGRIIIGTGGSATVSQPNFIVLNPDGSLNGFIPSSRSFNGAIMDLEVQGDGKVLVAGSFTTVNNSSRYGIARLSTINFPAKTAFDYDGDGKADLSVFRPNAGSWYISNSSNNALTAAQFGAAEDLIAPADFDGDGKTDISVFRPADGGWYRLNSSNNTFTPAQFGTNGDLPVPGDFDGDGKADLTVYRPSAGSWYRINSSNNQFIAAQFGISEDKPLVGDFDGDGKSDLAVFRPSNGTWYRI
ncbi:MAG TPA: FG-GAP-like repeat-containing protein, partial [Pyrinomonadaceae bacterium]